MKDKFGTEIKVGDTVAMVQPKYKDLVLGTVSALTPTKVRVKWRNRMYSGAAGDEDMLREPCQVIVKPISDAKLAEYKEAAEMFKGFLDTLPNGWLGRTVGDIGMLNQAYIKYRSASSK
jgi:hypothetical protein